ncbi:hypothetical protein KSP39_PZI005527 [Platanthera zijinensis]|uniref:Uncharacterized protein n=1 Tax=Platanthera zijinensis TaxID=2320716 RepID=A0AAP0BRM6_9ASPA
MHELRVLVVPAVYLVKSIKVDEKRAIVLKNLMRHLGMSRLRTVWELLQATDELSLRIEEVSLPFKGSRFWPMKMLNRYEEEDREAEGKLKSKN